jgi:hypothetical protein
VRAAAAGKRSKQWCAGVVAVRAVCVVQVVGPCDIFTAPFASRRATTSSSGAAARLLLYHAIERPAAALNDT